MKSAMFILGLLVISPLLQATEEPIESAFGLSLGQAYDVKGLAKISEEKGREDEYDFVPDHPYGPLTDYSVFVTGNNNTVYKIQATGRFNNGNNCKDELERMEKIMEKKYGKKNPDPGVQFTKVSKISFGKGARKIFINCSGFLKYQLKLVYWDKKLKKDLKKKQEKTTLDESRDTSGL